MARKNPWDTYTEVLKALSEQTRLKIIWLLCNIDSKICSSEIAEVLGETAYNISRHIRTLRSAGLIYEKKEGTRVYYYFDLEDTPFEKAVHDMVMQIPPELMKDEIMRCRRCLDERGIKNQHKAIQSGSVT